MTLTREIGNGQAPIKAEFVLPNTESETARDEGRDSTREHGMNKKRRFDYIYQVDEQSVDLCPSLAVDSTCSVGETCRWCHDIQLYMRCRSTALPGPCPIYQLRGQCSYGIRCVFYPGHTRTVAVQDGEDPSGSTARWLQDQDADRVQAYASKPDETNVFDKSMTWTLRKYQYPFTESERYLKDHRLPDPFKKRSDSKKERGVRVDDRDAFIAEQSPMSALSSPSSTDPSLEAVTVAGKEDDSALRQENRSAKPLNWNGKSYLAPLTTLGHLPFRRLCKDYGVDITCGEMAMAEEIVSGNPRELALLRRHSSETFFGVQICGAHPDIMTRCVEFIQRECQVDFIDVNLGCPIDMVFKRQAGSGCFLRPRKLEDIMKSICRISSIPITAKMRTGLVPSELLAMSYIPKFKEWGVEMVALHGRTRQQRYTKVADWDYIQQCSAVAKQHDIPLFGNGDILSFEEFHRYLEAGIDGCMIGRGALYKPWIFTEIRERRHWDISATERMDMLKQFSAYCLTHWGTDQVGLNKTRRYLLEFLSFLYRYIPVGLLEVVPQKMNERPPKCFGRNELETLMLSDHVDDWVKLSERVLGPAPNHFKFIPKHKSNAYETSG